MANGIFTVAAKTNEVKGKEVEVVANGIVLETGELIEFKDIFASLVGETVNFSIKVTQKDESEFEIPEKDEE